MVANKYLKLWNLVTFIYIILKVKKINLLCSLSFVSYVKSYKTKKKTLKKKLVLKLVTLQLEKIVFKVINFKTRINLKNVFTLFKVKKNLKVPKNAIIWRNWRLYFFNDFINILFFSVFFRKSSILSIFIAKNITNKKMHFNFLKKVRRLLTNFFFYGKYYNLIGILIKVHGKFQGILRKRRFKHAYGKTNMTTLTTFVDYDLQKSYTKFGVFSIKVYLFYSK